jgi:hypothetical protein
VSEPLFVDPDRLAQHAKPYEAAAQDWSRLHDTVADIQSRYNGAWGDDQLGNQFGPSFLEGMDSVVLRAKGVGDTLGYYGEGLVESGKIFGDAGDAADQSTQQYLLDSEYVGGQDAPDGARYFGVRAVEPEATPPGMVRGIMSIHEAEVPGERVMGARATFSDDGKPLEMRGERIQARPLGERIPAGAEPMLGERIQARPLGERIPAAAEPMLGERIPNDLPVGGFRSVHQEPQHDGIPAEPVVEGEPLLARRYAVEDEPALPKERLPADPSLPPEAGVQPAFYRSVSPFETLKLPVEPQPTESE